MLCKDIIEVIEKNYSPQYAMEWDNVGLLAGRDNKEVKCIYIALDATDEVIEDALRVGADMILTHHPLIFGGLKRINNQDFMGRRLIKLIANDISCYSMHTNYDVCGMADLSGEKMHFENAKVLEVTCETESDDKGKTYMGIGKIADMREEITLLECCESVKQAFSLSNVKVFGNLEQKVKRIAICPGSGKSVIAEAVRKKADVLVTGDIGHHEGIDSVAQGLAIIDAGHYGIEHIFIEDMERYLKQNLNGVNIIGAPISHPFQIV
ncbi:MAG: Nif3-like dinuclear metal center hexameric protein [Lachnospiraceae bacterium]